MFIVENRGSPIVDAYEKTIRASEIAPGTMKTVKLINGEKVLLVNTEGKFHGMGAICGHFEWDLSDGRVQGKKVVCAGQLPVARPLLPRHASSGQGHPSNPRLMKRCG